MTGNLIMGGYFINNIHDPMLNNDAVTLGYLNNNFAKLTAGGNMNMNAYSITNLASPTNTADAATKGYVDNNYVAITGSTMTGSLLFNNTTTDPTYIGCNNLANTKTFSIPLGSLNNQIFYNRNDATPAPISFLTLIWSGEG